MVAPGNSPTLATAVLVSPTDGRSLTFAENRGLYLSPGETDPDCTVLAVGTGVSNVIAATVDCDANSTTISWNFGANRVLTFTAAADICLSVDATIVVGPKINPTPVSVERPNPQVQNVQIPTYPGPRLGCAGAVFLTLATGTVVTLPSFAPNCLESELCDPFIGKPGVVSCVRNSAVPFVSVFGPEVHVPYVEEGPPVTVVQGCLYDQQHGVDANDDGNAEFSQIIKVFVATPCP